MCIRDSIGGAQAVAAFSYGTDQIEPVDLIVGPGNSFVTEAKRQCYGKVGIDFVAGPSEVLIIADNTADPEIIAADLLAQSEHDREAKGILVTTDEMLGKAVWNAVEKQLPTLDTEEIARSSWNEDVYKRQAFTMLMLSVYGTLWTFTIVGLDRKSVV